MEINICLSSDDNYAQHLGVTIASILKNAKKQDELFFYILDGGIKEENKQNLLSLQKIRKFDIKFIEINEDDFKNCPLVGNHITIATYYRFLIPTFLPDLDKVLYLDCDMIIEDSLSKLYAEDISDYWIGGVEDLGYYYHRRELKRETESFYINAGMILMNLKKWREDNIEEKLFNFAEENKEILIHQDQDVINMVLNQKSKPLDYKWNVQDSFYRKTDRNRHPNTKLLEKAKKRPSIMHYTGPTKPWAEYIWLPMAYLYLRYLKYTPWKDNLPTDNDVLSACIKSLFIYLLHHPFFLLSKNFWSQSRSERKRKLFKYISV